MEESPRMKWAKHFYNLIKHWFSFSHFTDIFTGANDDDSEDDFEYVQSCHRKWSSMRFVLLSKRFYSSSPPRSVRAARAWSVFGFVLRSHSSWSAANWVSITYIYKIHTIYYIYKYVCTLCYLLCRQDVAGWGCVGGEANVKLILPNCQLSDLYFEMDLPKCPLWP